MSETPQKNGWLISPRSALEHYRRNRHLASQDELKRQLAETKKDFQDRMFQLEAQHALTVNQLKAKIKQGSREQTKQEIVMQVPQALLDAIDAVRPHVAKTEPAVEAMKALNQQIANLKVAVQLEPKVTLYAPVEDVASGQQLDDDPTEEVEATVAVSSVLPQGVRMTCSTYPANDPSEDRYTVVLGKKFCFAGVWDGHAGTTASEFTSRRVFAHFQQAVLAGATIPQAFRVAYQKTDADYLQYARDLKNPAALFAGTCAIACYIDFSTGLVTCGNLGDSRAVMGFFENDELKAVPLSTDHTSKNLQEKERMRREHPHDSKLIVNTSEYEDDPDWRVKGIATFTRSLGDTHLKDKASAAVFNSYMPPERRVLPRPGVKANATAEKKTPPYLTNVPDIREATLKNGFIIIACDGVWDEMTNEEAVNLCFNLIRENRTKKDVDIAELFIEETLKKAVERIVVTYEEEKGMTLQDLKTRPQGKEDWSFRSHLHDDITVVILHFDESGSPRTYKSVRRASSDSLNSSDELGMLEKKVNKDEFAALIAKLGRPLEGKDLDAAFAEIDLDNEGAINMFDFDAWWIMQGARLSTSKQRRRAIFDAIATVEVEKQKKDKNRQATNEQILQMVEVFGGMNSRQLRILYNALDTDESGTLERDEVERLLSQVLQIDVTPMLVETAFAEMDDDNSGVVEFNEFCTFFGIEM